MHQSLQEGIAAQNAGNIPEARNIYGYILRHQPRHPDANHNMGLIAVTAGLPHQALPFFKTATEANPNIGQFWISYVDTLIKCNKTKVAKTALKKAKKHNLPGDILKHLKYLLKSAKSIESISVNQYLPQEDLINLTNLYNQGRLQDALDQANQLFVKFSNSALLNNLKGSLHKDLNQFEAAIASYQNALNIKPDYAIVFNNMGIIRMELRDFVGAIDNFDKALGINPNFANVHNNLGTVFQEQGDLDKALTSYEKALRIDPNLAEVYNNMASLLLKKGDVGGAIDSCKKVLKINPGHLIAQHQLAALTGMQTESAPRGYIEPLFDGYAKNFEKDLVDNLEYRGPTELAQIIMSNCPDRQLGSILDMGCGTGLFGVALNEFGGSIEGIDVSKNMLTEADNKNIYDRLTRSDIIEYLNDNNLNFDIFVAADVFIYLGELATVFEVIKTRNNRNGKLVFSTEHLIEGDFALESSGRYSHSQAYIEKLCENFGYRILEFKTINLRKGDGRFIVGGLYLLDF